MKARTQHSLKSFRKLTFPWSSSILFLRDWTFPRIIEGRAMRESRCFRKRCLTPPRLPHFLFVAAIFPPGFFRIQSGSCSMMSVPHILPQFNCSSVVLVYCSFPWLTAPLTKSEIINPRKSVQRTERVLMSIVYTRIHKRRYKPDP